MSSENVVPGSSQAVPPSSDVSENDRLMAALCYFIEPIGSAIVLLTEGKNRPYQRLHAIQSLGLFGVVVIFSLLATGISCVLGAVTGGLATCITWILYMVPLVPIIYYTIQAYQGKTFEIPYLTQFMRQQKWL